MCGIAGYLGLNGAPAGPRLIQSMNAAIRHRGPDGEGIYCDGPVGLGHRRLAILDLSPAGHQPMRTPDGRFVLTYNGEIYNYRELQAELESAGWQFHSRCDAEVVLCALAQWGEKALLRFNGMFALALWDVREQQLLLARDRYGIKPLYYSVAGHTFLFASEIKGILAHGAQRFEMDLEGLAEYLAFQNFFTDRTLFSSVHMLPAGAVLTLRPGEQPGDPRLYWDFNFSEPDTMADEGEMLEELDRLFYQAVSRQLVSDVPIGSYLSGGMDTGAITAIAARQIPNMCSFTIGFDLTSASGLELGFDERLPAERMSYLFGTEHYEMVLKAGDMERAMDDIVWHLEEPRVGQSYPNFYAAKLASRFGKVVLSGAGGDELFAGYPWRYYRAVVNDDFANYTEKYFQFWQRLLPGDAHRRILAPVADAVSAVSLRQIFRDVFHEHAEYLTSPTDYVNHSLYFEAKTFMHGILTVEDKLSMAHGLETRVPFLDNDLVDFAMQVPVRAKLGNLDAVVRLDENDPGHKKQRYFSKTRDGKLLLRKLMHRYVPADIADGVKQGFSAPDASWFRGESIDYVRRTLMTNDARIFDMLDRKTVHTLIGEHLEGKANRRLLVWSLLWLEEWCRVFASSSTRVREHAPA